LPFLNREVVWFGQKPKTGQCLTTVFRQSSVKGERFGYKREDFYTKLIDISASEDTFFSQFDKNTAYDIRRARKDGIHTDIHTQLDEFIIFYNDFALTKGLEPIGLSSLEYGDNLVITKAVSEGEILVMHAYLLDRSEGRVRLLYSASPYRKEEMGGTKRSWIGRANRLLHLEDMKTFKAMGFSVYDMGGYAFGTTDDSLQRINLFKDGFGGQMVVENDYWPLLMLLAIRLRLLLKNQKYTIVISKN